MDSAELHHRNVSCGLASTRRARVPEDSIEMLPLRLFLMSLELEL